MNLRFRYWFMFVGSFFVLAALFASDPDIGFLQGLPFGGSTLASLLILSKAVLAITFAHFGRKALFDYPEGDFQSVAANARTTSIGSGLLAIAYAIVIYGLLGLFGAGVNAQEINKVPDGNGIKTIQIEIPSGKCRWC